MILTCSALDRLVASKCTSAKCNHLAETIVVACESHHDGTDIEYEFESSMVVIRCHSCRKVVGFLPVANGLWMSDKEAIEFAECLPPIDERPADPEECEDMYFTKLLNLVERRFDWHISRIKEENTND